MNLGFDFDKVFINTPPLIPDKLIDRLYKKKSNGMLLYRIPSKTEQVFRLFTHLSPFRPPIFQNIAFIKHIVKQNNHKYFLISSRFGFLKQTTDRLVKKHKLEKVFNAMHFNFENKQPHLFKNDMIKKLNIHRYVDDDLPLLEYLSLKNKKTMFFWLNKNIRKSLKNNLVAITHLKEMIK